ncbi:hypothetical protein [Pedobacter chitinilyticus]|uniref:Uncharacterized protein n=1 Tax=Pedobacter chitinilyticus TaxID=2233776 RepID=A0A3S3Q1G8_9SPHI|nr:hypothetical protein [Pedobacter chitinilyticus]RWU10808.1 hypothetical protein DPV69_05615 [Pedobacter chitinilyticus]
MKAISKREHQSVIYALKQMESLLDEGTASAVHAKTLSKLYQRYHALLADLSVCINEYETLHHHLRVKVLAPALRKAKRMEQYAERR